MNSKKFCFFRGEGELGRRGVEGAYLVLLFFVLLDEERVEDHELLLLELGVVGDGVGGVHSEELLEGCRLEMGLALILMGGAGLQGSFKDSMLLSAVAKPEM